MIECVVSVAMATFNGEKYILEQLQSIARQTHLPDECVICDDGSTDSTVEIVEEFQKDAPFKIIIHKNSPRLGLIRNFEKAISLCKGDMIFLSDQDDVWMPEKIQIIKDCFLATDAKLIIHDCVPADQNLNPTNVESLFDNMYTVSGRDSEFVLGCCSAVRRELVGICLPFPESSREFQGHDGFLHYIAGVTNSRFVNKSKLIIYRRHGANASVSRESTVSYGFADRFKAEMNYVLSNNKAGIDNRLIAEDEGLSVVYDRIVSGDNIECAHKFIVEIISRKKVVQARINIRVTPKLFRPVKALLFYLKGGYAYFSGIKSLVVDLIR